MMTQPATGRAARLEDVAALAGVSTATASKALHNKPRISEETKQRVLDAAKQLNYSPNKLAQSLARGTTGTIGLVTSDLQGRFSTPILIGAENELRAQSTSVLLANARGDAALERQHVEKLLSLKVDGLLIVQCETNPRPTLGHDWGVPLVYVYGPSTDPKDCSVTCDNVDAGRMAINHLISCGRRHIAIIGGDETYTAATDRTKGALEDWGAWSAPALCATAVPPQVVITRPASDDDVMSELPFSIEWQVSPETPEASTTVRVTAGAASYSAQLPAGARSLSIGRDSLFRRAGRS